MTTKEVEERLQRGESVQMDVKTAKNFMADMNDRCYEDGIKAAADLPTPIRKEEMITYLLRYGNNATRFALFLHLTKNYLMTADAYAAGLREAYTSNCPCRRELLLDLFKNLPDRFTIMTPEERQLWEALPDEVAIYRGCDKDEAKRGMFRLSWTFSRAVAEFFAWRYDEKDSRRVVVSKTLHKNSIMAYFTERNEDEVIVDVEDGADVIAKKPTQVYYDFIKKRTHYTAIEV